LRKAASPEETIEQIRQPYRLTLSEQGDREVPATRSGSAVMNELHKMDSCVRPLRSVYRSFKESTSSCMSSKI